MMMKIPITLALILQFCVTRAEVVPNSLFSDHAILQRDIVIPVWGTGRNGEKVVVSFAGQRAETVVSENNWMVKLKPVKAGGPFVMTVTGDNSLEIKDVLVGEVWICSGQSNMAMRMSPKIHDGENEMLAADYPKIRQYEVPNKVSQVNISDVGSRWKVCTPDNVKHFTAVGYFFGRDLYKKLQIPVGLIFSAVGGTPIEFWTSREAQLKDTEFKHFVNSYDNAIQTYPMRLAKYESEAAVLLEKYINDVEVARREGKPEPRKPAPPSDPKLNGNAGGLYRGMISPLQPFAIKGVLWYQGEANNSNSKQYQRQLPLMIGDWRQAWGQGEFPFLFVQIAPFKGMSPELREAQLLAWQKTSNTAMVVTTDCGNAEDIHPVLKQPVGNRLALAARALAYGEKIEYSGPIFARMETIGAAAMVHFTHAKKLVLKGDRLTGFQLAGPDYVYVDAIAEIKGNSIRVYHPNVRSPVSLRYGWTNVPDLNLYNEAMLPASPFRTDLNK